MVGSDGYGSGGLRGAESFYEKPSLWNGSSQLLLLQKDEGHRDLSMSFVCSGGGGARGRPEAWRAAGPFFSQRPY